MNLSRAIGGLPAFASSRLSLSAEVIAGVLTTSDLCLVLLSGAAAFAVFLGFTRYSVAELGTIDELPQIINVLRGDMSLIGPRPHAAMKAGKHLFSEAVKEYAQRHRVKPGITGWA